MTTLPPPGNSSKSHPSTTIKAIDYVAEQQSLSGSAGNNPIRHAGRALVRGKFRRVWRPRYLEVRDNGLLSYYECPSLTPSSSSALDVFVDPGIETALLIEQQDDNAHSKIPKCTLWIHHARVIDPTTLRDMHVGLPRGAYGFLFHGHRIDMEDEGEYLLHDGLLACQGATTDATPRDFLCAVDSLEDAQSWVVALQWAASMGRDSSFHAGSVTLPYRVPSTVETWDRQEDGFSVASSFTSSQRPQQPQVKSAPSPRAKSNAAATTTTSPNNKLKQPPSSSAKTSAGKMVVTKVVGYTLVRLETWKWEIAYQIQVLLVMPTKEQQQVQEWSILRTAQNLELVVDKLKVSLPAATCQKLHPERMESLPKLSSSRRSLTELANSVAVVDSLLRCVCMEASVVNSSVVKRFLGVLANETVTQESPFWNIHNSTGLRTRPKRTILHQSIDQYVKQWLQQKPKESTPSLKFRILCWYLRLPQPATTYAGALLMTLCLSSSTLPALNRFIRKFQILPSVTIRVDALVFSWLVAAGFGNLMLSRPSIPAAPKSGNYSTSVSKKKTPGTATTTPQPSPEHKLNRKEAMRATTGTPNKSLMDDEDDSQDVAVEEDGEEEMNESADTPNNSGTETETSFLQKQDSHLSSPLPEYCTEESVTESCWSTPKDHIFHVRGRNYLKDRVKIPSGNASFTCRGVDMWMTDNPERHIARHPSVLGGQLANTDQDMFLVNFLLPFGNFVSYFAVPPLEQFANPQLAGVWTRFIQGDQQYRDARLKLLPVVVDGPWIVRAAVPGTSPALLGKVIPLQYFFTQKANGRSVYEVDVIITASSIAKGILSVVKGHAKALSIAFAFIIEAAEEHELPETVLASFQVNSLHLEDCPLLPDCNLDAF